MGPRLFRLLFVAHFFLPYIAGSRLRVEVVVAYACTAVLIFRIRALTPTQRAILAAAAASALWAGVRVMGAEQPITQRVAELTGYTFPLTAFATFVVFRPWLGTLEQLVDALIPISIPINLVAFEQARDPYSALNTQIFDLYGGYNTTTFNVGSLAEFEVKYAGRCTGIFNGMHVLAIFDVMILVFVLSSMSRRGHSPGRQVVLALAGICALVGGVLAASKSFYYGAAIAVVVMLLLRQLRPSVGLVLTAALAALALARVLQNATVADTTANYFETVANPTFDGTLGSRFGQQGFLRSTIDAVFDTPFILAVGAGPDDPTLMMADSAYLPLIVVGGMPLFVLFYASVLVPAREALQRTLAGSARLAPIVALTASFLATGIGIPTFQTGRVAPLLLVLTYVALWGVAPDEQAAESSAAAAHASSGLPDAQGRLVPP